MTDLPTHIYYDLNIVNNDTTGQKPPVPVIFNEIRNSPIVHSPKDYYVSVVRFQLETSNTLPTFIPQIKLNQADVNATIYSFTATYKSPVNNVVYESQFFMGWSPENLDPLVSTPPSPTTIEGNTSPYYFGYSIQHIVDLMNQTLSNCISALNVAVLAGSGSSIPNVASIPYFLLDETHKRLSLVAREDVYANTGSLFQHNVFIYANSPMFNLISGFQAQYYGDNPNIVNGKNYLLIIKNIKNSNYYLHNNSASPPAYSYNAVQMYQQYSSTPLWSPIDRIAFTTSLLPISPSLTAQPLVFNADAGLLNTGNNANISLLLTDFQVQDDQGGVSYKPLINYLPTAEYRLIDCNGNNPISAIQIAVSWIDKFGNSYPFYLTSNCNASVKLLFRRKDFEGEKEDV
jgi:hypothetical protein